MITDEELNERESWEQSAENSFNLPDEFVLRLINEVRELRARLAGLKGNKRTKSA